MFRQLINEHKYEFLSLSLVALGTWYLYKIKRSKLDTNRQDLLDKIVLITGANCGIGYETALELARRGATLILACRDMAKCSEASEKIRLITKNDRIVCEQLDLSSFESVRHFALNILNNYDRIDILINNAGVMSCPKWTTIDGNEYQMQVNHLSHFLLTRLLLDKLMASQTPKVINLISKLYESGKINWDDMNSNQVAYNPTDCYKQSKLAIILCSNELVNYLKSKSMDKIRVYLVSPGLVHTNLGRHRVGKIGSILAYPLLWLLMKTPRQGCECTVFCSINDLEPIEGHYFRDSKQIPLLSHATSDQDAQRMWNLSENLIQKWL